MEPNIIKKGPLQKLRDEKNKKTLLNDTSELPQIQ